MQINLKIKRSRTSTDQPPGKSDFCISVPDEELWTVLDLLDYIRMHVDDSIGYYRHSVCNRGICRRCWAKVNGRVKRICEYVIAGPGDLVLEPVDNKKVVKDLVTR